MTKRRPTSAIEQPEPVVTPDPVPEIELRGGNEIDLCNRAMRATDSPHTFHGVDYVIDLGQPVTFRCFCGEEVRIRWP